MTSEFVLLRRCDQRWKGPGRVTRHPPHVVLDSPGSEQGGIIVCFERVKRLSLLMMMVCWACGSIEDRWVRLETGGRGGMTYCNILFPVPVLRPCSLISSPLLDDTWPLRPNNRISCSLKA